MSRERKSVGFVCTALCLTVLSGSFGWTAAAQPASRPSLTVTPSSPIAISGPQGGPFSPPSVQYHLSASTGTIRFAIAVPFWLTADPRVGNVSTDGVTVTLSPNVQALKLTPRAYEAPVTFTNVTNGQGTTSRTAKLTVQRSATPPRVSLPDDSGGLRAVSVIPFASDNGLIEIELSGWWWNCGYCALRKWRIGLCRLAQARGQTQFCDGSCLVGAGL